MIEVTCLTALEYTIFLNSVVHGPIDTISVFVNCRRGCLHKAIELKIDCQMQVASQVELEVAF